MPKLRQKTSRPISTLHSLPKEVRDLLETSSCSISCLACLSYVWLARCSSWAENVSTLRAQRHPVCAPTQGEVQGCRLQEVRRLLSVLWGNRKSVSQCRSHSGWRREASASRSIRRRQHLRLACEAQAPKRVSHSLLQLQLRNAVPPSLSTQATMNIRWFLKRAERFAPQYFLDAVFYEDRDIPKPPPRLAA